MLAATLRSLLVAVGSSRHQGLRERESERLYKYSTITQVRMQASVESIASTDKLFYVLVKW